MQSHLLMQFRSQYNLRSLLFCWFNDNLLHDLLTHLGWLTLFWYLNFLLSLLVNRNCINLDNWLRNRWQGNNRFRNNDWRRRIEYLWLNSWGIHISDLMILNSRNGNSCYWRLHDLRFSLDRSKLRRRHWCNRVQGYYWCCLMIRFENLINSWALKRRNCLNSDWSLDWRSYIAHCVLRRYCYMLPVQINMVWYVNSINRAKIVNKIRNFKEGWKFSSLVFEYLRKA